jgi:tyrosine-protein phosphatase YwqE
MLTLDFEGLMKYFRVNIPKRYRSEEHAKYLMEIASGIKLKRLNKYEKEWAIIKAAERAREDPVIRYERENKKLLSDNLRLDTENDNLARQLVNSKIEMRMDIDAAEDAKDLFEKDLETATKLLSETSDEKKRLQGETEMLKSVMKKEVDRLDGELAAKANVVVEYKRVVKRLGQKLESAEKKVVAAAAGVPCGKTLS